MNDLFSIPMLLQYNPAVISVEEVRQGGFLADGTQNGPIVQRMDQAHGQAVISSSRMPNSSGVNGTGTLVGIVVKGLAPGDSKLSIVEVNARISQQQPDLNSSPTRALFTCSSRLPTELLGNRNVTNAAITAAQPQG